MRPAIIYGVVSFVAVVGLLMTATKKPVNMATETMTPGARLAAQDNPLPFPFETEANLTAWRDGGTAGMLLIRRHAWGLYDYLVRETPDPLWLTWLTKSAALSPAAAGNCAPGGPARHKTLAKTDRARLLGDLKFAEQVLVDPRGAQKGNLIEPDQLASVYFNDTVANYLATVAGASDPCHPSLINELTRQVTTSSPMNGMPPRMSPEFPVESIVIKAIWMVVPNADTSSHNVVSNIQMWDPSTMQPDPTQYDPVKLWKSTISIDLKKSKQCDRTRDYGDQEAVPLGCFYHIQPTSQEWATILRRLQVIRPVGEGPLGPNALVLVGFHVMTREIRDWTWQTYYWSKRAFTGDVLQHDDTNWGNRGDPRWSHYVMDTALSATLPLESDGGPKKCFNPYLEASRTKGAISNCIGCHQYALFRAQPTDLNGTQAGYALSQQDRHTQPTSQQLSDYNANGLSTSMLWSLADLNQSGSSGLVPHFLFPPARLNIARPLSRVRAHAGSVPLK